MVTTISEVLNSAAKTPPSQERVNGMLSIASGATLRDLHHLGAHTNPSPMKFVHTTVDIKNLEAPPEPWRSLASIGMLYLLGDLSCLGVDAADQYLNSHPLVLARVGRKRHVVVGQFRSWELCRTLQLAAPEHFRLVPAIVKAIPESAIADEAATNIILEGLLLTLSPDHCGAQLANIWQQLPEGARQRVLPNVSTQSHFADALTYRSRTLFDKRARDPQPPREP